MDEQMASLQKKLEEKQEKCRSMENGMWLHGGAGHWIIYRIGQEPLLLTPRRTVFVEELAH